jgi:hypothetical protein
MGSGESAEFPTSVKEVVTLLGKSQTRGKRSCILCLKAKEIESIPLVTRIPVALEIGWQDLTNRVCCNAV